MPAHGGDAPPPGADVAALPQELATRSLSSARIILALDDAIAAMAHLHGAGFCVLSWEGWVRMPDGGRAKSLSHGGTFALPRDPGRAAEVAAAGMRGAADKWQRNPEYPGAQLYFGLSFGAAPA